MSAMSSRMLRNLSSAGWTLDNKHYVYGDHRRERVPLKLWAVVAVAEASGQLVLAVLEVVQDGPTLPHYVHRPVLPRKVVLHPGDAVVEQVMPLHVRGHSDCPIVLPGHLLHKLFVVQLLPEQDVNVGFKTVCDAASV